MVITVNSPLLTYIAKTFRLSLAQSGFFFTGIYIGYTAFILFGGILADRLSQKLILSIALVGLTLTVILFPLSPNIYFAIVMILLIGGFLGIVQSNINVVI